MIRCLPWWKRVLALADVPRNAVQELDDYSEIQESCRGERYLLYNITINRTLLISYILVS